MNSSTTFEKACQHARQTALLQSTLSLLEWDQHTKMPEQAAAYRADQITALATQVHARRTDEKFGQWLNELDAAEGTAATDGDIPTDRTANIVGMKRQFDRQSKIPSELAAALARSASEGQSAWVAARKNNDFASFMPYLQTIINLKREEAAAIGFEDHPYDALIDEYEPGMSTSQISVVVKKLSDSLVPLVAKIADSKHKPDDSILRRDFPIEAQEVFAREVSAAIGFDYERGRLDVTAHPFCTELGPCDCRLTTRYDRRFFNSAFFGTMHEAGHGIYEQGLLASDYGLPMGSYCSLGIHESQSRLWENLVGRSRSFWKHYFPIAQQYFSASLSEVKETDFYSAINCVRPSLIRVEADEATYNLHIAIRFELERDLINDNLKLVDLPAAWNEKYQEYLGIAPTTDTDGVLQDVHWSAGLFGYFPTYLLGNLFASQFFEVAERELEELQSGFSQGDFTGLKTWLNHNIHQQGQRFDGPSLSKHVTGQELKHDQLLVHLESKYQEIYNL